MKKILIFVILLCLTGCSVQYDLTITDKEQVREKFYVYVKNEEMLKSHSSVEEYLDYYSNLYIKNYGYDKYKIKTKKSKPSSYFIVQNNYKNLDEYITSNTFKSMFDNASIERIGKYTSFRTSKNAYLESIKNDQLVSEESKYESFKISIKFYNEVVSSNADEIDKKNNIYTWIVSEDNDTDYINFKIGPKVKYNVIIMDYIQDNIISIIVVGLATIILASVILYIYVKSKKNNEV